jgi:hypothetical protein
MSDKIKNVLKSTVVVLIISILIGLAVYNIGGNFLTTFLLAFSCQYILFSFVASVINSYLTQQRLKKELDVLEPLSTILECAYCNHPNVMTFIADDLQTSEFTCTACNKKNSVKIQYVVARQTEVLNLQANNIIDENKE